MLLYDTIDAGMKKTASLQVPARWTTDLTFIAVEGRAGSAICGNNGGSNAT